MDRALEFIQRGMEISPLQRRFVSDMVRMIRENIHENILLNEQPPTFAASIAVNLLAYELACDRRIGMAPGDIEAYIAGVREMIELYDHEFSRCEADQADKPEP